MSIDTAASLLAGLIFVGVLYCAYHKLTFGTWPWQD